MIRRVRQTTLALALVFAGGAGPSPPLLPQRDVTVTYVFAGTALPSGGTRKARITYADDGQRVRIDYYRWAEAKQPFQTIIDDRIAKRLISANLETRTYTERPPAADDRPGVFLTASMRFTRKGAATVVGLGCTEWAMVAENAKDNGTACVTGDGVMLRLWATDPVQASITATEVHYGAAPAGSFAPPFGFERRLAR